MATFKVLKTIDACVRYVATVEAESPEEAARLAEQNEDQYSWEHDSTSEFDARNFVTLDSEGLILDETQVGDIL